MKKTQLVKKISLGVVAAAVAAIPIGLIVSNKDATKVATSKDASTNDVTYEYKPIPLEYTSYNVPIVMNDYHTTSTSSLKPSAVASVNYPGASVGDSVFYGGSLDETDGWWVNSACAIGQSDQSDYWDSSNDEQSTRSPFTPVNNVITIPNTSNPNIYWEMPYYDTGNINNCLKIDRTHSQHTITFSHIDSYANLYLLATSANNISQASTFKVNVNYASGTPATAEATFTVRDWFSTVDPGTGVSVANQTFTRTQVDKNGIKYGRTKIGSSRYYPKLYQCTIQGLDKTRSIQSMTIDFDTTTGKDMVTTIYGVCGAFSNEVLPPDPHDKDIKNKSATLYWNKVDGVAKYILDVYRIETTENGETIIPVVNNQDVDKDATTYSLTNLDPGTEYYYRMKSVDSAGNPSQASSDKSFTTSNAMTIQDATDIKTTSFTANWIPLTTEEQTGVKEYQLELNDGSTSKTTTITNLDQNSYSYTGLDQGTEYKYRIKYVYNDGTEVDWSSYATAKTLVAATGLTLNPTSANLLTGQEVSVESTVTGSPTIATNQNVTWSGQNGIVSVTTSSTNPRSHTIKALKPGATTLTATSKDGGYTATFNVTVTPNAPTITSISDVTYKSFIVNFTEPTEATSTSYSYALDVATDSAFTNIIKTLTPAHVSSRSQTVAVTGLSDSTKYYVRVRTVYGTYYSAYATSNKTTSSLGSGSISVTGNKTIDIGSSNTITTSVKNPDGDLATYQDVNITSTMANWTDYISITTTDKTSHKITAKMQTPKSVTIPLTITATGEGYKNISTSIDVKLNIPAPVASAATNVYPGEFTANWGKVNGITEYLLTVIQKDTGQLVFEGSVYGASSPMTKKISNLKQNTTYTYCVQAVSGTEKSSIYNYIDVTTGKQAASGLSLNINNIEMYVGETKRVISTVEGGLSGGVWYDAYDQYVYSQKTTSLLNVYDNNKEHDIEAISNSEGTYTVSFKHTTTEAPIKTFTKDCTVTVKGITAADGEDVGPYSFKANWENVGAQKYSLQVATSNTFEPSSIVKDFDKNLTSNNITVTGLDPDTTYYYRVSYTNNGYTSNWSNVITHTLGPDVTGLTLDKEELELEVNRKDNVVATVISPEGATEKDVVWTIDDSTIAEVEEVQTNDNKKYVSVKGLKAGETTLRAKVSGHPEIPEKTCAIKITNDAILPPEPFVKDITTDGATIYWDGEYYEPLQPNIKFIINVWYIDENNKLQTEEVVINQETSKYEFRVTTKQFNHLTSGRTYQFNVAVVTEDNYAVSVNKHFAIPKPFPYAAVIGGTIGGSLLAGAIAVPIYMNKKAKGKKPKK